MNRPLSPTCIMQIPEEEVQQTMNNIPLITSWRASAGIGFEYLQQKLNKPNITPGDGLLEFFNFDVQDEATDNDLLVPVFCLAICLLKHSQNTLDAISPGTYNSLFDYVVNQYNTKCEQLHAI